MQRPRCVERDETLCFKKIKWYSHSTSGNHGIPKASEMTNLLLDIFLPDALVNQIFIESS